MIMQAEVNSEGQLTLPDYVRDSMDLQSGGRINFFELLPGFFAICEVTENTEKLKGMLHKPGVHVSVEEMDPFAARRTVEQK